jgi:hypothetical protein
MYRKGKYFCIVMELAEGGSLGDLIEDTRGTVSRLSLHVCPICHR